MAQKVDGDVGIPPALQDNHSRAHGHAIRLQPVELLGVHRRHTQGTCRRTVVLG